MVWSALGPGEELPAEGSPVQHSREAPHPSAAAEADGTSKDPQGRSPGARHPSSAIHRRGSAGPSGGVTREGAPYPLGLHYRPRTSERYQEPRGPVGPAGHLGDPAVEALASPYVDESLIASRTRERRGFFSSRAGGPCAMPQCWLLILVTLNTLAMCWGFIQLRRSTAQLMHAQEAAAGELQEMLRSQLLPLLKGAPILTAEGPEVYPAAQGGLFGWGASSGAFGDEGREAADGYRRGPPYMQSSQRVALPGAPGALPLAPEFLLSPSMEVIESDSYGDDDDVFIDADEAGQTTGMD